MLIARILNYICIFLSLIIVLPVHEFAHAFIAVKNGDNTPKIYGRYTLNPLAHFDTIGLLCFVFVGIGFAKPVPVNPYNFRNYKKGCFWVAIAGVLANYILAFLVFPLYLLSMNLPEIGYFTVVIQLTLYFVYSMSLSFFVFNLIPVYPLDGFRVVDALSKKQNNLYYFLKTKGLYVLYGLFFISIISQNFNLPFDILGRTIEFLVGLIEIPIKKFWGLIF